MLRPHGKIDIIDDVVQEFDTITCAHCNKIVRVKPGTASTTYLIPTRDGRLIEEPGAGCRSCMGSICLVCCGLGTCVPLMKRIEAMEKSGRRLIG